MSHHRFLGPTAPLVALFALCDCTDASLYSQLQEPRLANKVSFTGQLCTDTPAQRTFPVKILFLIDTSGETIDRAPLGEHVRAVEQVVAQNLPNRFVEIGLVSYADRARSLISVPDGAVNRSFTRDEALIDGALSLLRNGAGGRDLASALSLVRSIVTGDAFLADRGPLSRTKYVVVHVTSGAPQPSIAANRCDTFNPAPDDCELTFLEQFVRDLEGDMLDLGVAEFRFHVAYLEPATLEGTPCDPRGPDPSDPGRLLCTVAGTTCVAYGTTINTGRCMETCDPSGASSCSVDPLRDQCSSVTARAVPVNVCTRPVETACFDGLDNDGDGGIDCSDPGYPLDCDGSDCEADCLSACRAERIGISMSLAAGGSYERFETPDTLTLGRIDFRSTQSRFVRKSFIVDHRNAIPTEFGLVPDTDADGISDEEERRLDASARAAALSETPPRQLAFPAYDPLSRDSDGDGFHDGAEVVLSTVGLEAGVQDLPPDCLDPFIDSDGDDLNDCEEQLLGSDPSLFDTDADGLPDELELRRGTNLLVNDVLLDLDQDGVPNGREVVEHTDVSSNDASVRASFAYRYAIRDAGITSDNRTCYDVRVSNVTLLDTLDRGRGPGINDIDVYFGQVPENDVSNFGLFLKAQVPIRYVSPDFKDPNTAAIELEESDFVFIGE